VRARTSLVAWLRCGKKTTQEPRHRSWAIRQGTNALPGRGKALHRISEGHDGTKLVDAVSAGHFGGFGKKLCVIARIRTEQHVPDRRAGGRSRDHAPPVHSRESNR